LWRGRLLLRLHRRLLLLLRLHRRLHRRLLLLLRLHRRLLLLLLLLLRLLLRSLRAVARPMAWLLAPEACILCLRCGGWLGVWWLRGLLCGELGAHLLLLLPRTLQPRLALWVRCLRWDLGRGPRRPTLRRVGGSGGGRGGGGRWRRGVRVYGGRRRRQIGVDGGVGLRQVHRQKGRVVHVIARPSAARCCHAGGWRAGDWAPGAWLAWRLIRPLKVVTAASSAGLWAAVEATPFVLFGASGQDDADAATARAEHGRWLGPGGAVASKVAR